MLLKSSAVTIILGGISLTDGHELDPSMDWIGSVFPENFMDWIGLNWIVWLILTPFLICNYCSTQLMVFLSNYDL